MRERTIMASKFKQQCLALLDQVANTKVPLIVTKHGKAVARVVPLSESDAGRPVMGSVTVRTDNDADLFSTGESWGAETADSER